MHGRIKPNRGERSYRCNTKRDAHVSCKARGINIDKLNDVVWNAFRTSLHYHRFINSNIDQALEKPSAVKKQIDGFQTELEKLTKQLKDKEAGIKQFLIRSAKDSRIKKSVYDDVIDELNKEKKHVEDNILTCQSNISMLAERLKVSGNHEDIVEQGYELFDAAESRINELYPQIDEKKMAEARQMFRDSIKNIQVTWNEKSRTHEIELEFSPINGRDIKSKPVKLGIYDKVRRIDLPPIEFVREMKAPEPVEGAEGLREIFEVVVHRDEEYKHFDPAAERYSKLKAAAEKKSKKNKAIPPIGTPDFRKSYGVATGTVLKK